MKRDDETQTAYTMRLIKEEGHREALAAVQDMVKAMADANRQDASDDEGCQGFVYACDDILRRVKAKIAQSNVGNGIL